MKHFYLKFTHGVEIGAKLAYFGHYERTKDRNVLDIAYKEEEHRNAVETMLRHYGEEPSRVIDQVFGAIGNTIGLLCLISPRFMLNFVASSMETFAVFSYGYLAVIYPDFRENLTQMALEEQKHEQYFKGVK